MPVMTVSGPVAPEALGMTLAHEHLLCDLRALWHAPPPERPDLEALVDVDPTIQHRGPLVSDPYVCRLNLLLDDPALAIQELAYFREAGGGALVELTTLGLNPRPDDLRRIADATGIQIIAGCGWYRQVTNPPDLGSLDETALAGQLIGWITDGFLGGVRPGIIGEIGTGDPIHPDERKALRAAVHAQRATGLAIAVHLAIWGRQGNTVLDELEASGAALDRVVLCHLGEQPEALEYQLALLRRGAWLSYDTFGAEYALDTFARRLRTDEERINGLVRLLEAGYAAQLLISQDTCERLQLRAYGGYGYAHLLTTILPRLRRAGVDQATLDTLLRHNPARLLTY